MASQYRPLTMQKAHIVCDQILAPKLDLQAHAKSHFYPPPNSCATTSLHSSHAAGLRQIDRSNIKRKRPRHASPTTSSAVHLLADASMSSVAMAEAPSCLISQEAPNHSQLIEIECPQTLAGGRCNQSGEPDTPTTNLLDRATEDENGLSPDLGVRRGGCLDTFDESCQDSYFHQEAPSLVLTRERNGYPQISKSPCLRDGLARAVYTVPILASKVWDFCRTSTFRGFFAGEGQGFEMKGFNPAVEDESPNAWHDVDEKDLQVLPHNRRLSTPVPGGFPIDDYIPDYMSYDHTRASPPRTAKRQQVTKGCAQLGDDWTVIDNPREASRETSPSRLAMRKTPTSSSPSVRRPVSRFGKRPILSVTRPSLASQASSAGVVGLRGDRPASYAPSRSPGPRSPLKHGSPVSEEVQRHAARMKRREMEEDANLQRMNQQMKALIREGKEALGTRFEVDEEADAIMEEEFG